jgi:DNA primase
VVCEGPFDALSMMAAGHPRTVAVFGVHGWRWEWVRGVDQLVLALDADPAGQEAARRFARAGRLRGKTVALLPPGSFRGAKDINEWWRSLVDVPA